MKNLFFIVGFDKLTILPFWVLHYYTGSKYAKKSKIPHHESKENQAYSFKAFMAVFA
jgi:hypothetical protein